VNELRWYDKLLQWLGLMTVARHDYEVAVVKYMIAERYESYIEEARAERDELVAENERCAGLMSDFQQQVDWSFADLRRADGTLYDAWVELNNGHPETAKHLLDTYFRDDDDDFCDGGDDDALCTETAPADSGGVPEEP
jgi:hypothetical protein